MPNSRSRAKARRNEGEVIEDEDLQSTMAPTVMSICRICEGWVGWRDQYAWRIDPDIHVFV